MRPAFVTRAVALGALLSASGTLPAAEEPAPNAYYVVLEVNGGAIEPVFFRPVALARPPSARRRARGAVSREESLVDVRLVSAGGQGLFQDAVPVARWTRAELPREGDRARPLSPSRFPRTRRAFTVRVPIVAGARLRLRESETGASADLDLDELAARRGLLPLARAPAGGTLAGVAEPAVVAVGATGSPANRLDLLVLGDGYTAAQAGTFASDAANVAEAMLAVSPYAEYRSFVNVTALFTASAQPGADHPPYASSCVPAQPPTCCSDPQALSDPLAGTSVSTAYNASYCLENFHRLIYVDEALAQAAAAASPDWDAILMVVNDSTYGGAGGKVAVASLNAESIEVARHEWGHSFTGLADEYSVSYPDFPPCSDVDPAATACEANVTDQTDRALLKWSPWVDPSTPVPTPDMSPYLSVVGLFEGARYLSTGMYRPRDGCRMRSLGQPFCEVCAQEFVRRLYGGGWGVPADGIDPIEPGSESPPPGARSGCWVTARFSAALLQPSGGPALQVSWLVNGAPQAGASSASFAFDVPHEGTYTVEMRVHDPTPLVHPAMALGLLDSSRTWTLMASAPKAGDVNGSCAVDVSDVFVLINALFAGGPAPLGPADANGDGTIDVGDVFYLINFLFAGGPAPVVAPLSG